MTETNEKKKRPSRDAAATQERLEKILYLRMIKGYMWAQVAEEVGMSLAGVKKAYGEWLHGDREALLSEDLIEVTQRILRTQREHRSILGRAIELAEKPGVCDECGKPCGHVERPGVLVGAAKALEEITKNEVIIRQLTGLMPRDLGDIGGVISGRQIALKVLEILDRHMKPDSKMALAIRADLATAFDVPTVRALPTSTS